MTILQWGFDAILGITLMWLAWRALTSEDLFQGIVLFIAFGLLMALVWVRLDVPDIALAEAAIGAGLTGALLLAALEKLEPGDEGKLALQEGTSDAVNKQTPLRFLIVIVLSALVAGLSYVVLSLPLQSPGLSARVAENLHASGVNNPVTAVLMNFRGYDTLLEMAVLFLAVLGVWALAVVPERRESAPGAVLEMLSHLLVPLLILVSGYLLWAGSEAAGGAFQAGAVLAAAGVLLLLAGWRPGVRYTGLTLRLALVMGLAVFVIVAIIMLLFGLKFLEFPSPYAGALILLIEAAAAFSIGITLAALFFGNQPQPGQSSASREGSEIKK